MNDFINLDRSFTSLVISNAENSDASIELKNSPALMWKDVIDSKRAIILAEAGSGKTAEIKEQTRSLIKNGHFAFFLRLESLIDGFDEAFYSDISSKELFNDWCDKSNDVGYFFLDSVDESKIKTGRDFYKAINNFSRKILRYLNRCNIYITSRISAWQPNSDLRFVCNELSASKSLTEFQVFSMRPLSISQVKYYAQLKGVISVDDFISAIKKNEVDCFASRPLDLDELINHWNENLSLANRSDLLRGSIENKLNKADRSKDFIDLSYEQENYGVEILATANVFCQKTNLELTDTITFFEGLSVRNILTNWKQREIDTLLSRPIFEPSQYGTVRFYNIIAREFLTARFLWRMRQEGKLESEDIEEIFLCNIYGIKVFRNSLRPILSWYIIHDKSFYSLVENIAPEIFLQGGDPSLLSIGIRERILEQYCDNYESFKTLHSKFDANSLIRFCTHQLSPTILNLLNKHKCNDSILQLLLKMAIVCNGKNCTHIASIIFEDKTRHYYTRVAALELIVNDISYSSSRDYLNQYLSTEIVSSGFLASIISYFSSYLDLDILIISLSHIRYKNDNVVKYSTDSFFKNLHEEKLESAFYKLSELIIKEPYDDNRVTRISKEHYWLSESIEIVALRLISIRSRICLENIFLNILSRLESRADNYSYRDTGKEIKRAVIDWPILNDALFWFDIEDSRTNDKRIAVSSSVRYWFQANNMNNLWSFSENDFERVISWIDIKKGDDIFVCISLSHYLANISKDEDLKKPLMKSLLLKSERSDACKVFLDSILYPKKSESDIKFEEQQRVWEKEVQQRKEKSKINNKRSLAYLIKNINEITDIQFAIKGEINGAQGYLLEKLLNLDINRSSWGSNNWRLLEDQFGIDISTKFREAAILYWREFNGVILRDKDTIPTSRGGGFVFSICGLSMEYEQDDAWAKKLSNEEAKKACLFGFAELNNCANWLESIEKYHPDIFYEILVNEIKWEMSTISETASHHVLYFIISNAVWLKKNIATFLFSLLKETEPVMVKKVSMALKFLFSNDVELKAMSELARDRYKLAIEDERKAIWLSTLIKCSPNEGIYELSHELEKCNDIERNCNFAMLTLTALYYEESFIGEARDLSSFSPKHLCDILEIMYIYIDERNDLHRASGECFSPGLRDNAQDARNNLVNTLGSMSGREAYFGLKKLAKMDGIYSWRKEQFEHLALSVAMRDAEMPAWSIEKYLEFISSINKESKVTTNNFNQEFNIQVGDNNSGSFSVGQICLSSVNENKNEIIKELNLLINEISKNETLEGKDKAVSQLELVHDELTDVNPNIGIIEKCLKNAGGILNTLDKGTDVAMTATTLFTKLMLLFS